MDQKIYKSRLRSLKIVLVLSMIGSGANLISNLITGMTLPMMNRIYHSPDFNLPAEMETYTVYLEELLSLPQSYFLTHALLYCASLAGVILMWNLRKSGFHLYTLAQLLILLVTALFYSAERLSLGDVMLTLLFIVFYYLSFRTLGVFSGEKPEMESGGENYDDNLPTKS